MGRDAKSFRRGEPKYKAEPTVLILCEDKKSSKTYLQEAAQGFRVNVHVEVAHCGHTDPKGIVLEAISRENKYDIIYCAIDRDRHATFDEALRLARGKSKLSIVVSYPCFEFWLLLHFSLVTKPYTEEGKSSPADCVIRDLRTIKGMENYAKGEIAGLYASLGPEKLATARRNAVKALEEANKIGNLNPSTRIHILFDHFETLSSPQLIAVDTEV